MSEIKMLSVNLINNLSDMESYMPTETLSKLMIPAVYEELLTAYCYEKLPPSSEIEYRESLTMQDFPELYMIISCKDLQGMEIIKKVELGFEPVTYEKDANGSGKCSWKIRNLGEQVLSQESQVKL